MSKRLAILTLFGLVLALTFLPTIAQVRRANIGSGGHISSPGSHSWSPVREFRANSVGVGDLPGPRPATGGGVLGSSIYTGGPPRGTRTTSAGHGGIQNPSRSSAIIARATPSGELLSPAGPATEDQNAGVT